MVELITSRKVSIKRLATLMTSLDWIAIGTYPLSDGSGVLLNYEYHSFYLDEIPTY